MTDSWKSVNRNDELWFCLEGPQQFEWNRLVENVGIEILESRRIADHWHGELVTVNINFKFELARVFVEPDKSEDEVAAILRIRVFIDGQHFNFIQGVVTPLFDISLNACS